MNGSGLPGCTCEHAPGDHQESIGCTVWLGIKRPNTGYCDCWAGSGYMLEDYEGSKVEVPTLPAEDPSVVAAPIYEERWEYSGHGKKRLVQTVTGPWIAESEDV